MEFLEEPTRGDGIMYMNLIEKERGLPHNQPSPLKYSTRVFPNNSSMVRKVYPKWKLAFKDFPENFWMELWGKEYEGNADICNFTFDKVEEVYGYYVGEVDFLPHQLYGSMGGVEFYLEVMCKSDSNTDVVYYVKDLEEVALRIEILKTVNSRGDFSFD